jgi:titin
MDGVYIADCEYNTIGGASAGQGNVISGNTGNGVRVSGGGSVSNAIIGNLIGTDKDGANGIPNGSNGVQVLSSAWSTQIGGDQSGEGNLISGNTVNGVEIIDTGTYYAHLQGNLIGTDLAGMSALPNGQHGVRIASGAWFNVVGGASAGARNVISGNSQGGVLITGTSTIYNDLRGNYIGTSVTGQDPLPNIGPGVSIEAEAGENTVGGASPGYGNLIAFNTSDGVRISGSLTSANEITRNRIFQNGGDGIALLSGANMGIAAPAITSTSLATMSISGSACGSCVVEVFANPDTDGEGMIFLGSTTASAGGSFTLTVGGIPMPYLTATATDAADGTSEFSPVHTSSFGSLYLPLIMR